MICGSLGTTDNERKGKEMTVFLDRNKLLKDLQDARVGAYEQFKESGSSQAEDVYWTGYIHAIEDMVTIVASGFYDAEEESNE